MAGGQGHHGVAAPVPLGGPGGGSAWRTEACGTQTFSDTLSKASWGRPPSWPWQRGRTRRPPAAPCWRLVRGRRSTHAGWLCQPQAAHTAWTRARGPHTTRGGPCPRRRRRTVLRPGASSRPGRGRQRGGGAAGPRGRHGRATPWGTPCRRRSGRGAHRQGPTPGPPDGARVAPSPGGDRRRRGPAAAGTRGRSLPTPRAGSVPGACAPRPRCRHPP